MNFIRSLKGVFIDWFSAKPADPAASPPAGSAARENKTGDGAVRTRCINPDYGCRFEVP
jgi:hypothetical protein